MQINNTRITQKAITGIYSDL